MEHETDHLNGLQAEGLMIVEIPNDGSVQDRVELTIDALKSGPDAIYQATFLDNAEGNFQWRGHADFLLRVPVPSSLGAYSYEPIDTKLASRVKPAAVLQLCEYAFQLERLQGISPKLIHVVVGDGAKVSLRLSDFAAYYRVTKARFETACSDGVHAYPWRVAHCQICIWRDRCDQQRIADDHVTLVAGLGREQAEKIDEALGITTVAQLARSAADRVDGIGRTTFANLRDQARLQKEANRHTDRPPPYELLEHSGAGRGLAGLPTPSPGDLFFDIEGDPYVGTEGIEYLLGVGWVNDGAFEYKAFWGHTPEEERSSFEEFIDFVSGRLQRFPDLHIFHYASYEKSAISKLMSRYGTREIEVDALFRGDVLVDLLRVVKQSVRVGTPSYSLKKLEGLYMESRTEAITDAGSSIEEYERWLEEQDSRILVDLEAYNRVDCDSTRQLRDWLEGLREEFAARFGSLPGRPSESSGEASDAVQAEITENDALKVELRRASQMSSESGAAYLLADLLDWYRREDKPVWWEFYHRVFECDEQDLYDDTDSIAGLEYLGIVGKDKRSNIHRYKFDPAQEFKLKQGDEPIDPVSQRSFFESGTSSPKPGSIVALDADEGLLELKLGEASNAPIPRCLIPGGPLPTKSQREALRRIARSVIEHGIDGDGPYRALRDLLMNRRPRVAPPQAEGPLVRDGEIPSDAVVRLGSMLDSGCLSVQGPPGSGKTRSAARLAVSLIKAKRTVGITANSHSVITNLLDEIVAQAARAGVALDGVQKSDGERFCRHPSIRQVNRNSDVREGLTRGVNLVAGTAWLLSSEEFDQSLDFLIVDEAGQYSLANTLAVGTAARNVVLVGDPRQLAQPTKGIHPGGAGVSALDHVLAKATTLPVDLGIFLDLTHRLHPAICDFISEVFYDFLSALLTCQIRPPLRGSDRLKRQVDQGVAVASP
jgi:uncharacterized protein